MRSHFFLMALLHCSNAVAKNEKAVLNVLTYASFDSQWGAGKGLKERFETYCNCKLVYQLSENSLAIVASLKIAKGKVDSDVVLGLDTMSLMEADEYIKTLSDEQKNSLGKSTQEPLWRNFVPIDYSFFTFMVDTQKVKNIPRSLSEFLNSADFKQRVILQDPRSSSPGLGLLYTLKLIFHKNLIEPLQKLRIQTLTVGKGWSETYGLFTKGESWFVWSYITSESYHREEEKSARYQAMYFEEGHLKQVEYAGVLKTAKNLLLAQEFLNFLVSAEAQKIIAEGSWMFPVNAKARELMTKKALINQKEPTKILALDPSENPSNEKRNLVETWLKYF